MLTYVDPVKFQQFLNYEGLDRVLEAHQKCGLPPAYFKEIYTRFAKSLVQVGPYRDDDVAQNQAVGLPIDLVALQSPYAPQTSRVDVLLLCQGKPLENIQIATFQRMNDGTVARRLTRSDAEGLAGITLDGGGPYQRCADGRDSSCEIQGRHSRAQTGMAQSLGIVEFSS